MSLNFYVTNEMVNCGTIQIIEGYNTLSIYAI